MQRRLSVCGLSLLLAVGCSDPAKKSEEDTGGSGGSSAGSSSAGTKAGGGAAAAGGSAAGTGGSGAVAGGATKPVCNELELDASPAGFDYDAEMAPDATGGDILDGTYFLTTQILFGTPSGPTLPLGRTKIAVEGDVWQEVSGDPKEGSVNPDVHVTRTLEVSGTLLTLTSTCPSKTEPRDGEYTVHDDGFTVYSEDRGKTIGSVFIKQ